MGPFIYPRFKVGEQILIVCAMMNPRNMLCAWTNPCGGRSQHWAQQALWFFFSSQRVVICISQPVFIQRALICVKITSFTLVSLQDMSKLQALLFTLSHIQ